MVDAFGGRCEISKAFGLVPGYLVVVVVVHIQDLMVRDLMVSNNTNYMLLTCCTLFRTIAHKNHYIAPFLQ